jgi:hypothetical protein
MMQVVVPKQPLTPDEEQMVSGKSHTMLARDLLETTAQLGKVIVVLEAIQPGLTGWELDRVNAVLKQVKR